MFERFLILLGLALLIAAGWGALQLWRRLRLRQLRDVSPLSAFVPTGRPAVVSFSTPTCAECRTRQAPALTRLGKAVGDQVTIQSLSALEHPDLVQQLGILSVPATVVLDAAGRVRSLNLAYTSDERLLEQLQHAQ